MQNHLIVYRRRIDQLLVFLFMFVLLQGCKFVEVSVNVQPVCPTAGTKMVSGGPEPDPTACFDVQIVNPWNTDDNTYYATGANQGQPVGTGKQCISGSRCRTPASLAGKCTLGGLNCKTWYWPTADPNKGSCDCDCPNAH